MGPLRARPTTATRGFTLVEVLVALLIMAVIAAMGWQGVSTMVRSRDIGAAAGERTLRLATLVAQWEQDLGAIYDSPQVPGLAFDGGSLRLVRRVEGGVQVVVWAVRDGAWWRWPGPVVQRVADLQQGWLASQQLQGNEPGQLRLLDGVREWQIYFWRGQGWSNAQSSGDLVIEAPAAAAPAASAANTADGAASAVVAATPRRTQLPAGVRLQIELAEGRLLRDVMLPPTP
jgi:general secretion pathway protein J